MSSVALEAAPQQSARAHAILFGKMPGHGDFVHRGLPEAAVTAWDEWATAAMLHARERLGERFEQLHDGAPPWCFISGPGRLGDGWRIGVLAPSTDNVGRRFILVLGIDDVPFAELVFSAARVLDALLGVLYRAFAEQLDADTAQSLLLLSVEDGSKAAATALGGLIAANGQGVWWPHLEDVGREAMLFGAEPDHDLIYRALAASSGDRAP